MADPAPGLDDYPGPVLRAWIELEVDARINRALRQLSEGELSQAGLVVAPAPGAAAKPGAATDVELARQEVRAVAQSQARLLQVVGGLSAELGQVGKEALRGQQELGQLAEAVQQLRASLSAWRTETAAELRVRGMRGQEGAEVLRPEAATTARRRDHLEEGLGAVRRELAALSRSWNDVNRFLEDSLKPWMRKQLSAFEQQITCDFKAALEKQQEALLALDEQLWRTDMRLSKDIEAMRRH